MQWWMFVIFAYLFGSVPYGYLIGRINGIDIRDHGSGNIGATNLGRVLGRRFFFACFFLDMSKGMFPTLLAGSMMGTLGTLRVEPADAYWWMAVMLAAVLGHMFSPFLGMRGGKGVATGLGALVGVFPAMAIPAAGSLMVYLMVLVLWRYVSLASSAAAATLPLWVWLVYAQYRVMMIRRLSTRTDWEDLPMEQVEMYKADIPNYGIPFFVVSVLVALLVIYKHRGNLARITAGVEPRMGESLASPPTGDEAGEPPTGGDGGR